MFERFLKLLEDFFNSSAFSSLGGVTYAYTGQPCDTIISKEFDDSEGDIQLEVLLKGDCHT